MRTLPLCVCFGVYHHTNLFRDVFCLVEWSSSYTVHAKTYHGFRTLEVGRWIFASCWKEYFAVSGDWWCLIDLVYIHEVWIFFSAFSFSSSLTSSSIESINHLFYKHLKSLHFQSSLLYFTTTTLLLFYYYYITTFLLLLYPIPHTNLYQNGWFHRLQGIQGGKDCQGYHQQRSRSKWGLDQDHSLCKKPIHYIPTHFNNIKSYRLMIPKVARICNQWSWLELHH